MATNAPLFGADGAPGNVRNHSSPLWTLGVSADVLAPAVEPRDVQFILDLRPRSDPGQMPLALVSPFVSDGESLVADFHAGNSPGFGDFTDLMTNGESDLLRFLWRWRDDACPLTCPEGGLIGEFDLVGHDIDLVRLLIEDIRIGSTDESGPDDFRLTFLVTYEFYGTVVPEPGSGILMAFGVNFLHFRRRRTAPPTV